MLESVLQNLINIGWAMLIFLAAYLANVAFSLWYNIKILHESFDKDKLIASGLKILTFVVGLTLLCTAITTLPLFANQVGWAIPEEYSDPCSGSSYIEESVTAPVESIEGIFD